MSPSAEAVDLLDALRAQMRPSAFQQGLDLGRAGRVTVVGRSDSWAKGRVRDLDDAHFEVSLDWTERLASRCECPAWGEWDDHCPHAAALGGMLAGSTVSAAKPPEGEAPAHDEVGIVEAWLDLPSGVPLRLAVDLSILGTELQVGLYRPDRRRPGRFLALAPEIVAGAPVSDRALLGALMGFPSTPEGRYRVPEAASGSLLQRMAGRPLSLDGMPIAIGREPAYVVATWAPEQSSFSIELRVDGKPVSLSAATFIGLFPTYALVDDVLHRIEGGLAPAQLARFQGAPTLALPERTGAAFDRAASAFLELGILLDGSGGPQAAPPSFVLTLEGGVDSVRGLLAARYGPHELPVTQTLPSAFAAVGGALIQRDLEREREAVRALSAAGLASEGEAFVARGDRSVSFWLEGVKRLPPEWAYFGPSPRKVAQVRPIAPTIAVRRGGASWFELDLSFAAEDASIDLAQIRTLLASGRRYVKLSDGTVGELSEAIAASLTPLLEESEGPGEGGTLQFSLSSTATLERLADVIPDARVEASIQRLFELFKDPTAPAAIPAVPLPRGLRAELRPYQKVGYDWLALLRSYGLSGILADEMGLGKTLQTLAHLAYLREKEGQRPSLVIAPTSLLTNWQREAARFTPDLKILSYDGPGRAARRRKLEHADLVVTSYAVLRRDIGELRGLPFRYVVLDEAQHVKNPASLGAQAARALEAESRLVLTGTPIENHLFDLWSLLQFLMPGYLGGEAAFRKQYAAPIEQRRDRDARERLKRKVRPLLLRRLKSEVERDLPPKTETILSVDLTTGQQALYREMLETARQRVRAIIDERGFTMARVAIAAELLRLRQLCNDPRLLKLPPGTALPPSAKLEAFTELVRDLIAEGHRALVFSQFTEMLRHLCAFADAEGIPYEYLDGSTTDRQSRIDRFNARDGAPLFFISLKAGGFGLNLTAADYVIHFDPWWNPAAEDQATDRAHRIGQTRPVFSYKVITRGTVEEKILALQAKKKALATDILGDEESFGQKLTEADVAALFA